MYKDLHTVSPLRLLRATKGPVTGHQLGSFLETQSVPELVLYVRKVRKHPFDAGTAGWKPHDPDGKIAQLEIHSAGHLHIVPPHIWLGRFPDDIMMQEFWDDLPLVASQLQQMGDAVWQHLQDFLLCCFSISWSKSLASVHRVEEVGQVVVGGQNLIGSLLHLF